MDVQGSQASQPQLPDEIIEAVLLKAPVETVLRFRCVSQPWRALVGSKRFIAEHLKTSPAAASIFIFNFTVEGLKHCEVDSPVCKQIVEWLLISRRLIYDPVLLATPVVECVVGCIDGLVCCLDSYGGFCFWNPSTRVTTLLPKLRSRFVLTPGFGFDESTGEFKVFAVDSFRNEPYQRKVYSSRTSSWKVLGTAGKLSNTSESGILIFGKLHWERHVGIKRDIVYFDVKSEAFGEINMPERGEQRLFNTQYLRLGVLRGHLTSLIGHSGWELELWVMEEYGVKDSWTKVANLDPPYSLIAPFCAGPGGEILFIYASNFVVYYPNANVFRIFEHTSAFRGVHHCVKSLVTPDYALTD